MSDLNKLFNLKSISIMVIAFTLAAGTVLPALAQTSEGTTAALAMSPSYKVSSDESEIVVYGIAAPIKKVEVSAKVGGTLEYLPFLEGDTVKSGEVLFVIEKTDYELQVELAKTQVERAQVAVAQAKLENERADDLFKKNSASSQTRDNANFAYLSARSALSSAVANLKIAENFLKNTVIYAPMNGIVSSKIREAGDFMDKGKPVLQMVNLETIKANLKIPELIISKIKKGDRVDITVDAYEKTTFAGEIYEIKPLGDQMTHFFEVTALIKNPDQKLKAGMFLEARIKK